MVQAKVRNTITLELISGISPKAMTNFIAVYRGSTIIDC